VQAANAGRDQGPGAGGLVLEVWDVDIVLASTLV